MLAENIRLGAAEDTRLPKRKQTAIRTWSSDMRKPRLPLGSALSHADAPVAEQPNILARFSVEVD